MMPLMKNYLQSQICSESKSELQRLLAEAEKLGKDGVLKETWKQDVEERMTFQKDQKRNGIIMWNKLFTILWFNF